MNTSIMIVENISSSKYIAVLHAKESVAVCLRLFALSFKALRLILSPKSLTAVLAANVPCWEKSGG